MGEAKVVSTGSDNVLLCIAEAFWPRLDADAVPCNNKAYCEMGARDFPGLVAWMQEKIAEAPAEARTSIQLLLWSLTTRAGTLLLCGSTAITWSWPFVLVFTELDVAQRTTVLKQWRVSPIAKLRQGYFALKELCLLAIFSSPGPNNTRNPLWDPVGYPGPSAYAPPPGAIHPAAMAADALLKQVVVHLPDVLEKYNLGVEEGVHVAQAVGDALCAVGMPTGHVAATPPHGQQHGQRVVCRVTCDAVVVGSGAGGGVAAAVLTKAGMRVLVLEKGTWTPTAMMGRDERVALSTMFECSALTTTRDLGVGVLAGSGLGGGTRINWCASFRTPAHVRREWEEEYGVRGVQGEEYEECMNHVCSRLGVHEEVVHDGQARVLQCGLDALGIDNATIPRNCLHVVGCASGHKQDTVTTWLQDAVQTDRAHIITGANAHHILLENTPTPRHDGRKRVAVGVAVCASGTNEVVLEVHAPLVISSAGSLHTPALLLRSGIQCRGNVGKHLRLHPAVLALGVFPSDTPLEEGCWAGTVKLWEGVMMSAYSRALANWGTTGYGPMLSIPQHTLGLFAAMVQWEDALAYRKLLLEFPYASHGLVFCRDQDGGRVSIDGQGRPVLEYWPSERDRVNIMEGLITTVKALAAAGAHTVLTMHLDASMARLTSTGPHDPAVDEFCKQIQQGGIHPNRLPLFSAHQMGSCRMGGDPAASALDPDGQCWEVAGLYCADASVFPTPSGVNPMITVESMACMITNRLGNAWRNKKGKREGVTLQYEEGEKGGEE